MKYLKYNFDEEALTAKNRLHYITIFCKGKIKFQ